MNNKNKWPIISTTWRGPKRTLKVKYMTRTTEFSIHTDKCTTCRQCIKSCPQQALSQQNIPKGTRVSKIERIPYFEDPLKCVFCGVCMTLCPYDAISMGLDGESLGISDLPLFLAGKIPELALIKVGKVETVNKDFSNAFWDGIMKHISK